MPRGRPKGLAKSPGTGRKKGSLNKRTVEVLEILQRNGYDPHAPFLYWARVLASAMRSKPAKGADKAEKFYQGVITISDGSEAGAHVHEVWARASADMANAAAANLAQYIAPKRATVRIDFRKPHDMSDDELDAAIRAAFKGTDAKR